MPFGLANAPSYFQSVMDRVLSGIGGVICYIDDVLIATASIEEHLALLKTIFARLAKYNIKLKKEKCLFLQKEIEYLGHLVTEEGIRPLDHKVQAIQKAKTPTNISELRSFLGLVNFYGKFIPNLPELLKPLHELLHKKRPWVWTKECGEAIDKCKNSITSERVLVPYDATLPLCLATDASQIGVGAVLSHIIEGQERPIMFASRTLSVAEQNYSQIEKKALLGHVFCNHTPTEGDLGILGSAWERFRARGGAGALHEDGGARSSAIGRWLDYRKGCLGPSWTGLWSSRPPSDMWL
ncbi:K02A2.6-like [Cordylochernes scorpioides]|uniref:K02A2.6-like n=1 Tax=Cordylochernes scorpioides TaxID=51811 RepID=A0ABY6L5T1_9ARAC|nr:K02A2.6-like [Cordylochernes scorpioides]